MTEYIANLYEGKYIRAMGSDILLNSITNASSSLSMDTMITSLAAKNARQSMLADLKALRASKQSEMYNNDINLSKYHTLKPFWFLCF